MERLISTAHLQVHDRLEAQNLLDSEKQRLDDEWERWTGKPSEPVVVGDHELYNEGLEVPGRIEDEADFQR